MAKRPRIVPKSLGPTALIGVAVQTMATKTADGTVAYWTNDTQKLGLDSAANNLFVMVYTGSGAPSSTTLTAGVTYQVGNFYWDTSGHILYICSTAGDLNTSVWTEVS